MATTTSSALPLARHIDGDRTGAVHRIAIAAPDRAKSDPARYASAALAALIHRYTGETDLLIARRTGPGPTETIEPRVSGDETAAELLAGVAAAPPAQPAAGRPCHGMVADAAARDFASRAALTLCVDEATYELLLSQDEFDEEAAAQYGRHLARVLCALSTDDGVLVRDLPLLGDEERQRILVEWNRTEQDVPEPFFHEIVADFARRTPEAIAIALPDSALTYRELDDRANRLAHRLAATGVRRRDRVGVCFPRGAESLIAQLACFKLAAAAILLDPDFPADRVRFMVEDASAAAVVTLSAHEDKVSGHCPVLSLDVADWHAEPSTEVSAPVDVDDLIHICYTSGSTGAPKAVLVRFGAARNQIHSMCEMTGMNADTQGTWLAAPGYGMVEVECFPVLAAGGTVHIPDVSVVASPQLLQDWYLDKRITTTLLMKPMAERLWSLDWPADTPLANIRVCGERIQSWPPAGLPFRLINLYGSAEATTVAGCDITELGRELGAEGRARRLPPIGRPIPNVKIYVLDENLAPVPPGVVGELCIAGHSLSAGYLNRPEATALKWVSNPIDPDRNPVLYRTGDMARYWQDGGIEIIGRVDNQLKVQGNTVQLGEIEVVAARQPGVAQVAVLAHRDTDGDVRLTAYIEPKGEPAPAVPDIRRALREKLPAFMVPSAYVVGGLPTSVNGKIDRAALPEPPRSRPDLDSPYREPRTDTEHSLVQLWTKVLELDGIGVRDNFFELGGDSLRGARLTEQVRELFDIDVELGDLLHEPTIDRMAAVIEAARVR
ncbi:amino acid adenylation domain-containing protein [Embleya sp. NPDC050154]|uniref:amino acid adenylation domain-containing protein n=1 Tax=unclassified Embleya TaxID=2699296 RepID=UPI0037B7977F